MGLVVLDIFMSLDGFIAGPHNDEGQPLGDEVGLLHHWLFRGELPSKYSEFFKLSKVNREVFEYPFESTGAMLV